MKDSLSVDLCLICCTFVLSYFNGEIKLYTKNESLELSVKTR